MTTTHLLLHTLLLALSSPRRRPLGSGSMCMPPMCALYKNIKPSVCTHPVVLQETESMSLAYDSDCGLPDCSGGQLSSIHLARLALHVILVCARTTMPNASFFFAELLLRLNLCSRLYCIASTMGGEVSCSSPMQQECASQLFVFRCNTICSPWCLRPYHSMAPSCAFCVSHGEVAEALPFPGEQLGGAYLRSPAGYQRRRDHWTDPTGRHERATYGI